MLRVRIDMPDIEEKIACFYSDLQNALINWAQNDNSVTYLAMEGCIKPSDKLMSICFDITAYANKDIVNYRRFAQVWDEKGNLISRNIFRKMLENEKRFPKSYRSDGFYVSDGEEIAIFNRFNSEIAKGMRKSRLSTLIYEISASENKKTF